jgi:hypothetical protein
VRAQGELPTDATTSIFPLPLGRVGVGNTWTPDFVVVREGRAGLIEVDGPHHGGRRAADATPAAGAPRVAMPARLEVPASSLITRRTLGWKPVHPGRITPVSPRQCPISWRAASVQGGT